MKLCKSITVFCILFVLSLAPVLAQKCKFEVDKKDEFTNQHVRSVRHKIGNMFYSWWLLMEQKGDKYYMTVQSATTGKVDDIIYKGSKILFKLENGKIIELVTDEDCIPSHNVVSTTIITMWLPKGQLSKDDMTQLSESEITGIRMKVGDKDFDSPDVGGKVARKIKESAVCFLTD